MPLLVQRCNVSTAGLGYLKVGWVAHVKIALLLVAFRAGPTPPSFSQLTQQKCSPYFPLFNPSSLCVAGVCLQILVRMKQIFELKPTRRL